MDLAHRDRIAFLRICSGKFTCGMKIFHHRIGREIILPEDAPTYLTITKKPAPQKDYTGRHVHELNPSQSDF